jgi:hypothetical protein
LTTRRENRRFFSFNGKDEGELSLYLEKRASSSFLVRKSKEYSREIGIKERRRNQF